jgi:hypothetical protein
VIARQLGLDPALASSMLAAVTDGETAFQRIDEMQGVADRVDLNLLTIGVRPIQGEWQRAVSALQLCGGSLVNAPLGGQPNLGDAAELDFLVPSAGTYTVRINAPTDIDAGIVAGYLDRVLITPPGGYDLYAAVPGPLNAVDVAGLVLTAGKHTAMLEVIGMNVASTNVFARFSGISLRRTA